MASDGLVGKSLQQLDMMGSERTRLPRETLTTPMGAPLLISGATSRLRTAAQPPIPNGRLVRSATCAPRPRVPSQGEIERRRGNVAFQASSAAGSIGVKAER